MRKQASRRRVLRAAGWLAAAAAWCGAGWPWSAARAQEDPYGEIHFGVIATERSSAMRQMWEPFLQDMARAVGRPVRGFYATDYAAIVEAQRFHKVQVAWYGSRAAIDAVDRANGEVFAQFVDADGSPGYYSYLICRKDSAIGSLEEVLRSPGRYTFGIGDPDSLSGTLVPSYFLFQRNHLDPRVHFRALRASNHEGNFLAVLNGQVDVATSNSEMLQRIRDTAPEKAGQIRILWQSEPLPRDPLVWDRALPAGIKEKIRAFVLGYGKDAREKQVLHDMYHLAGFRAADDSLLLSARELLLRVERSKVEQDAQLAAPEKAQRLAAIDRSLADLARRRRP